MFEDKTYENILGDMLNRVTSDVDKREGSIIYDALAPCAYQLAQAYFLLNNYMDLFFADTAIGKYLDLKAADYGLTRKEAISAVRKIETTGPIVIGTGWGMNEISYTVTSQISDKVYSAVCNQPGEIGNTYSGALQNIDNITGVTATLTDIITPGVDEETDDNLRARLYAQVQAPPSSGNASHYKNWATEVTGVGSAKVFPLFNGPGTVKVVVVDNDMQPVDSRVINETAEYIEAVRPIGAAVTVVSGTAKTIGISAVVSLAAGYSLQSVISAFRDAVTGYFRTIAFNQTYVSNAKIGTILLGTDGVADYSNLRLNGSLSNVILADEEIPALGTVDLEV